MILPIIGDEVFPDIPVNEKPYKIGDRYTITVSNPQLSGSTVQVRFFRDSRDPIVVPITTGEIETITLLRQCTGIEVPAININGQTLIDGSDVGSMIFTIDDKFNYYKEKPISLDNQTCTLDCITQDQLKQTVFEKCCPKMVSVVKGNDDQNLNQKVRTIWDEIGVGIPYFNIVFYPTFIEYGMVKLILSRILYGHFDINFLLWKYNAEFLKDLSSSRFCNFVQYFNNTLFDNFNLYFKYK